MLQRWIPVTVTIIMPVVVKIVRQQSFGRQTTALCTGTTAEMLWYSLQKSAVLVLIAQLSITWLLNWTISGKSCSTGDIATTSHIDAVVFEFGARAFQKPF